MRRYLLGVLVASMGSLSCATTPVRPSPPTVNASGVWTGTYTFATTVMNTQMTNNSPMTLALNQTDTSVTGTCDVKGSSQMKPFKESITGWISGNVLSFTILGGTEINLIVSDNNHMGGGTRGLRGGISMSLVRGQSEPFIR